MELEDIDSLAAGWKSYQEDVLHVDASEKQSRFTIELCDSFYAGALIALLLFKLDETKNLEKELEDFHEHLKERSIESLLDGISRS